MMNRTVKVAHMHLHATLAFLLSACGARSSETGSEAEPKSKAECVEGTVEECALHRVPLDELLAQADRWRGRRVVVEGYLHHGEKMSGLHPSEEDDGRRNLRMALAITNYLRSAPGPVCKCQDQDVVVVGTYDPADKGPGGAWGGALKDVEQVQPRQE